MKIAILTQPLWANYGGILQAYALQEVLKSMGHKVEVINRDFNWGINKGRSLSLIIRRFLSFLKTLIYIYILKREGYILVNPLSRYYHTIRTEIDPLPFVKRKIACSRVIRTSTELELYFKRNKFDAYVVGSDQVWRPRYSPCIADYFLQGLENYSNVKRIAYAASFGTDVWEYSEEQTRIVINLISKFDAVSVREQSGVKLCNDFLKVSAMHLLDPTMLLNADDYVKLYKQKTRTSRIPGDVFCYILDSSSEVNDIIKCVKEMDMTPFHHKKINTNRFTPISVEQWLRNIHDARFIITDSFHACVFSILFKKPFCVWVNRDRGTARFDSLLKMFHLEKRIITSLDDFQNRIKTLLEIDDTNYVDDILLSQRMKSYEFLNKYL